jgi:hypothetical protein
VSATSPSIPVAPRARRLLATLVVALVLAVALVAIGGQLVMSANSKPAHGAVPGLDHSGGVNRYQLPR